MWSYLVDLECTACGRHWPADELHGTCPDCGKVLLARYDLERLRAALTPSELAGRAWSMWRYHELMPVRDPRNVISLGEGATPLLRLSPPAELGFSNGQLLVKDEGQNPTGSFKARGLSAAVSRAHELGVTDVSLPSAGNAGAAAAAYAVAGGLSAHVAVPSDVPKVNLRELEGYGADVSKVDGLIDAAGAYLRERGPSQGWFDVSTLKEPYRAEGKKTMGLELAEQGGFGDDALPDVVVYPAGGGTGIVGMWKAFDELEQLGWIGSRRPRMVIVQAEGCAPLVRAFERGDEHAEPWTDARTAAAGIRVPSAIGDYLILAAVRDSGGTAVRVAEDAMPDAQATLAREHGISTSLEGAATFAALPELRETGFLDGSERVVLFSTASGLK